MYLFDFLPTCIQRIPKFIVNPNRQYIEYILDPRQVIPQFEQLLCLYHWMVQITGTWILSQFSITAVAG